ncbi:hypothetical protein GF339_17830, partial [candidate division KSB3 bacterium]|nr:hypothetical protein [candidate division KSB3 bacterium]MBD3326449.1 hypothetical protein [candidate division KSB3 bacterium]
MSFYRFVHVSCCLSCLTSKEERIMKHTLSMVLVLLLIVPGVGFASEDPVEELKIISTTPEGNLNSLDDAQAISVTFNYPVVALSGIDKELREGPLSITPEVSGTYRWMGTSTLSFIPDEPLTYATRYVVRVNAPITSVNGEIMREDVTFSFVTPRPQVERVYPNQNQNQVTLQQPLFLRFSQPINIQKAASFFTLTSETGTEIPIDVLSPAKKDVEQQNVYWLSEITDRDIEILPQQSLTPETTYTLRIKAGLPGRAGNLGMARTYELKFTTYNYFRAEGITPARWDCGDAYYPEFGIRMTFSNPVKRNELLQHLRFEPEVSFEEGYSYASSDFNLSPGFEPNTQYTLTLDATLTDQYGNSLGQEKTFTFTTTDYAPYLTMPSGRMIAEAYLGTRFPIKIMNVYNAPFKMRAYRTPEHILQAVKAMGEYDFEVVDPDVDRMYRPDILNNKVATMPFDLSEVLHEGEATGIIGLSMEYTTCSQEVDYYDALIFLTNLSVTAKFSAMNNLLWVTQLEDSAPVEGAEIELYDEHQQFLWGGVTDAEGFLETPGWKELGLKATDSWDQPWVFALVRAGDDQVVIHSRDGTGIWPYRFGINYRQNSEHLTTDGYLFTERGIYRPGEDVHIVGIIRDKVAGEFVVPEALDVEVQVTDPQGKELFNETMRLSDYGTLHFPLTLPENAKIGTYWIECTFPLPEYLDLPKDERDWVDNSITGEFRVEMYRPVEFEVKIDLPKTEYIKGDTLTGEIRATYLFGGAVRNVPVEWNLSRTPYYFSSQDPQFKGYTFTASDRQGGGHVTQESEQLDDNGEYRVEHTLTDSEPGSFSYSLEATVTDVNKRRVSNRQSLIVHGGEYYIGIKPESFFADTDDDFAIHTIALTPDETLLPDQVYQVQVKRIWWESVRRVGNGGRLYWETEQQEEVVHEFQVQSQEKPVELSFPIEKVGYYKIEASGTDARGNEIRTDDYFYATGSGYAAWMRTDD